MSEALDDFMKGGKDMVFVNELKRKLHSSLESQHNEIIQILQTLEVNNKVRCIF